MGYYRKRSCGYYGYGSYRKSYDNSTRQTYSQRYSPTKHYGTWYDAGGDEIRDVEAYFDAVDRNGRYWEDCDW